MNTIYLDPAMVPATLRGAYNGKKFSAVVCERMTIPNQAGVSGGGSRDTYSVIELATGRAIPAVNHNAAPWDSSRHDVPVEIKPGIAVIRHTIFCGKDMGLCFYVHPDNAAKLLLAPADTDPVENIVLSATAQFKSHYDGKDRYMMARDGWKWSKRRDDPFPSRDDWQAAKDRLIAKKLLNKAGAITPAGRNAAPRIF